MQTLRFRFGVTDMQKKHNTEYDDYKMFQYRLIIEDRACKAMFFTLVITFVFCLLIF